MIAMAAPAPTESTPGQARPEPEIKPAARQAVASDEKQNTATDKEPANTAAAGTAMTDNTTTVAAESPATAGSEATDSNHRQNGKETPKGSSGGFFSWLFDLLFGWIA